MAIAYRYYSAFLAAKVACWMTRRLTPAIASAMGRIIIRPTNGFCFGHHFAAISGAGPLIGPVLAAHLAICRGALDRHRRLPGRGGAGFSCAGDEHSPRRAIAGANRRSRNIGPDRGDGGDDRDPVHHRDRAGRAGQSCRQGSRWRCGVSVPGGHAWGTFTIACTIPIALFVGLYMYRIRKGK